MRTCLDCPASIETRPRQTRRCFDCARKRQLEAARRWRLEHPTYFQTRRLELARDSKPKEIVSRQPPATK